MTGRVSMSDVAASAGVSQKTVSRVVNGEPHVSEALRERVLREIARLGYRPNESARALVTRRSRRIGIVATGTSYFGPAAVLRGLERAARRAGYYVSVGHADDQDEDETRHLVTHLVSQGLDGVVIATWLGTTSAANHVPHGIPVLAIGYPPAADPAGPVGSGAGRVEGVGNDEAAGARAATEYLLRLGHRTVHHVAGAPGWEVTEHRVAGWRAALRAAGAAVPPPVHGDWSPASGHRATTELLRAAGRLSAGDGPAGAGPALTALFVANDQMAIGAVHALTRAGLRVPDDVSVVGYDDVPEAAYLSVPLTTVRQDFDAIAEQGMRRLIAAITGTPPPAESGRVPVELVVRDSATPPREGSAGKRSASEGER
ncbi:LacI family DNA-binding transcriptional regulator [Streptomyces sp. B6B3]|uniref:LacI family DNA-binding transcriptional regulator n=1 Tax=Streptomyces sp. B6B3 TaxID=3153570 RepID=UPI00325F2C6D